MNGSSSSPRVMGCARMKYDEGRDRSLRRRAIMTFPQKPKSILMVVRPDAPSASDAAITIARWLRDKHDVGVLFEKNTRRADLTRFGDFHEASDAPVVDLCVTLGGDGTVLHAASLFPDDAPLPPVLPFAAGSLGFLTPFSTKAFEDTLSRILGQSPGDETALHCTLHSRKRCRWELASSAGDGAAPPRVTNVLNEVAVMNVVGGSGMSIEVPRTPPIGDFAAAWRSGLASLFLHVDGQYVACMRGDGLLVATGTGSTAYALAAGGPCVSPSVPCTLVVPVSPHTLSCRPLVLPELATIRVEVGEGGGARAVLDGRHAVPLSTGDALVVEPTVHHLPVLTQRRHDGDWYGALTDKLGWSLT